MKTKLSHVVAVARHDSSASAGCFAPESRSRPHRRRGAEAALALEVDDWAEGQGFQVFISQIPKARHVALRLSFSDRFLYG